jgi:hypothetical protein
VKNNLGRVKATGGGNLIVSDRQVAQSGSGARHDRLQRSRWLASSGVISTGVADGRLVRAIAKPIVVDRRGLWSIVTDSVSVDPIG